MGLVAAPAQASTLASPILSSSGMTSAAAGKPTSTARASAPGGRCSIHAGSRSRPRETVSCTRQFAFDGVNYFVVWTDDRPGEEQFDIYGTRVSQAGVVLDRGGIPIATGEKSEAGPSSPSTAPTISSSGTTFARVSRTSTARVSARRDQCSTKPDSPSRRSAASRSMPTSLSTARITSSSGVTHEPAMTTTSSARGSAAKERARSHRNPRSQRTSAQLAQPHVAYGGGDYLVAWTQWIGSRTNILASGSAARERSVTRTGSRISIAANDQSGRRSPSTDGTTSWPE